MLEPTPTAVAVLTEEVAAVRAGALLLGAPPLVVEGWVSLAAADYDAAVVRIATGILRMRGALDEAVAALMAP